jgi:hypothetical protein
MQNAGDAGRLSDSDELPELIDRRIGPVEVSSPTPLRPEMFLPWTAQQASSVNTTA